MAALHNVGADAPGPVTPTSDEAPAVASGEGFKAETADSLDFAIGAVWLLAALSWLVWIVLAIEGRL